MAGKTVEFSARVDEADYLEFLQHFGGEDARSAMYGASAWLIRNSLKNFNRQMRENPALIEGCRKAVTQMVEAGRG
jgi:hypothetical protein